MLSYNVKFPLRDDPETNNFLLMTKITKDAFVSDLMLLLLTEKGERYYMSDYGTNLIKFIFEPNDNMNASDIETEIKETVSKHIPSLTIDQILFNWLLDDDGNKISDYQLNVKINFTYSENFFTEQGSIDLNF